MIKDSFNRLLVLLLVVGAACTGLYWLPGTVFGLPVKKVDLLADIRLTSSPASIDSLRAQLEDTSAAVNIDSILAAQDSLVQSELTLARKNAIRDSLERILGSLQSADPSGKRIEDYSPGHTGLKRFFATLNNRQQMNRPVRIAFMGDSFIEGDIMVADFRNEMQKQFGGQGVGFVPVTSKAAAFRPTIEQKAEGWNTFSMIEEKRKDYTLSGMLFEAKSDQATITFKTTAMYNRLKQVTSLKLLYEKNENTSVQLACNGDTLTEALPATNTISQYVLNGDTIREGCLTFTNTKGFQALGLALEDNQGVIVDNFALRGNSGLLLEQLKPEYCTAFQKVRPYDLIILQYGLNAVDESMLEYNWYRSRMIEAVNHLKACYPDTDILLLSISDRGNQYNGQFSTMPAVLSFLLTQRQIARQTGIPFWNMFGAMGGENSIVKYVENGWASKDYTHLNFRGGREIARKLMDALMTEKKYYDGTL